jgi:hypothetical protein
MFDLGAFYVSDFVKGEGDYAGRKKYPLNLEIDEEIGAVKLTEAPPHSSMWGTYWYRSGINNSMRQQLKEIVEEIKSRVKYESSDIWLDIACNDGTLLEHVGDEFYRIGIDPAEDSFVTESSKHADKIVQDYFSLEAYLEATNGLQEKKKAKVITTIAMFYDLEDPRAFIEDAKEALDDNGVWVLQMSYTPLMIQQMAFDNICHEHFYYYSLSSLKTLFESCGMKIVDASLNDTNGGSVRIYVQKDEACKSSFGTPPLRDVCDVRIKSLLEFEKNEIDISSPALWEDFYKKIIDLKEQVVSFIKQEKAAGKTICGYGASTKGNTLLQLFELDSSLIDCIAERSPYKFGLKTIGTNIPIVSEETVRAMNPDYLLILPWHFVSEFIDREKNFLNNGGKFIIPCPTFDLI